MATGGREREREKERESEGERGREGERARGRESQHANTLVRGGAHLEPRAAAPEGVQDRAHQDWISFGHHPFVRLYCYEMLYSYIILYYMIVIIAIFIIRLLSMYTEQGGFPSGIIR